MQREEAMIGPCLCGDPACGSCFPSGQVRMKCECEQPLNSPACVWRGKLHECENEDDNDPDFSRCPLCGCPAVEDEEEVKGYGHGV